IDQAFSDAFTRDFQLVSSDPFRHTFLAAALLVRGAISASDLRRNIDKLHNRLRFVAWNREGWKVGHCLVPPVDQPYSLLALSNNTAVRHCFSSVLDRFQKLYKRKAHLHHYTNVDGFDQSLFRTSQQTVEDLRTDYEVQEQQAERGERPNLPRLEISD
ncbi:Tubulin epsilon 1, partial [Fasciolopsis buskii]